MDPMFTKYLEGVSVEEWAEMCWLKDGEATDNGSGTVIPIDPSSTVFGSFLVATGNSNVVMNNWETSAGGVDSFHGEWDNEAYSHRRIITYDKPGGGFSSGSIQVKQTQDFRYQAIGAGSNDKEVAIVAFTVNILAGIPYADAFKVQVRWVATSMPVAGAPVIRLQVGCFVVFSKKVMVAGIIKSSTLSSSLDDQNNTLEAMKAACGAEVDKPQLLEGAEEKGKADNAEPTIDSSAANFKNPLVRCLLWIFNGLVWMIATVTSAVVSSVLDNKTVQQAGARFVVYVVEQASQDPQLAKSLVRLVPSPPPMRSSAPEKQSFFEQLTTHPSTSQRSSNEFITKEE